jgi:P-type Na+/K+ transporter
MTFLGLIGIFDGLRPESIPSVQLCQRAGIVLHMLTGDHINTATAIAREAGIITDQTSNLVMIGEHFDRLSDYDLDHMPVLPAVVARCSPQTKVRMIEALQRRKRLTAMIGDGVNDSLSVKKADVGIAMGGKGSDVTRQAAEIVLEDDNFSTIVSAIMEGRQIFQNQLKLILYLMSSNCAEVIVLVAGLSFRDSSGRSVYPLSPVQILWENLITCALPAFGYSLS